MVPEDLEVEKLCLLSDAECQVKNYSVAKDNNVLKPDTDPGSTLNVGMFFFRCLFCPILVSSIKKIGEEEHYNYRYPEFRLDYPSFASAADNY